MTNDYDDLIRSLNLIDNDPMPEFGDSNLVKILLLGSTGNGKSTIADILAKKQLLIKSVENNSFYEGEGVDLGFKGQTKIPRLLINNELNLEISDCPGFQDSDGKLKEILNAYAIDKLFQENPNNICRIKVLIVISSHEIKSYRSNGIDRTLEQLEKMFPDIDQMTNGIGLIISMGEPNMTAENYINFLKIKSNDRITHWCDIFLENLDQNVFLFPIPSPNQVDTEFQDFPDLSKLIDFLRNEQLDIVNPKHQVGLNDDCNYYLNALGLQNSVEIYKKVDELVQYIKTIHINENQIDNIIQSIRLIAQINLEQFETVDELESIIQRNLPDNFEFEFDFPSLKQLDDLNNFTGKVLKKDNFTSSTKNVIMRKIYNVENELILINELNERQARIEDQDRELNEQESQIERQQEQLNQLQSQLRNIQSRTNQDPTNNRNNNSSNTEFWCTIGAIAATGAVALAALGFH